MASTKRFAFTWFAAITRIRSSAGSFGTSCKSVGSRADRLAACAEGAGRGANAGDGGEPREGESLRAGHEGGNGARRSVRDPAERAGSGAVAASAGPGL